MIDCGWQGGSQYKLFDSLHRMTVTLRVEFKSQNIILKSMAHLRTELQRGREPTPTDHHQVGWAGDEESMMPFIHLSLIHI